MFELDSTALGTTLSLWLSDGGIHKMLRRRDVMTKAMQND
jgi:hypothetical protein